MFRVHVRVRARADGTLPDMIRARARVRVQADGALSYMFRVRVRVQDCAQQVRSHMEGRLEEPRPMSLVLGWSVLEARWFLFVENGSHRVLCVQPKNNNVSSEKYNKGL